MRVTSNVPLQTLAGDKGKALVIANHYCRMDWIMLWMLEVRHGWGASKLAILSELYASLHAKPHPHTRTCEREQKPPRNQRCVPCWLTFGVAWQRTTCVTCLDLGGQCRYPGPGMWGVCSLALVPYWGCAQHTRRRVPNARAGHALRFHQSQLANRSIRDPAKSIACLPRRACLFVTFSGGHRSLPWQPKAGSRVCPSA